LCRTVPPMEEASRPVSTTGPSRLARNRRLVWLGLVVVFGWLAIVAVTLAIRTELFDFGSDFSNAQVAGEVWAFLGTGLGAVGALIAVLFTASYQDRTYELARQTEKRQRDEAAAGFLALLSTEEGSGKKPTAAQYVGVILCLRALEHKETARGVLSVAIDGGDLPPSALALLLDAPLRSSEEHDQRVGSRLLLMAAGELTDDTTAAFDWPEVLSQWPAHFPREAQVNVLAAIGRTLASQPLLFWHSRRDWAAYLLDEALISTTSDDGVKDSAYLLQRCLLRSFERGLTSHLNRGEERRELVTFVDNADDYHLVGRYDATVKRAEEAMKSKWADDRTVANGDQ
jgi:hypothetical protein